MNIIDKKKMLEGLAYSLKLSPRVTEAQMTAIIEAKNILRSARIFVVPSDDGYSVLFREMTDARDIVARGLCL